MKEKLKHYTKEIISFSIFIVIFANIISYYKSTDLNKEKLSIINLELIDKSNYKFIKDKPLLVHFWASWCPTCKLEAQNIQLISEHFEVLSIAVKSGSDYDIQNYLQINDFNFSTHNDNEGKLASTLNIAAYPTTFIYDKNKNLIFSEVGYTSTIGLWLRMWWAGK
jgi:thiol-disulfide isomerase/thioredoxin